MECEPVDKEPLTLAMTHWLKHTQNSKQPQKTTKTICGFYQSSIDNKKIDNLKPFFLKNNLDHSQTNNGTKTAIPIFKRESRLNFKNHINHLRKEKHSNPKS